MKERMEVLVLGRVIGTAGEWDDAGALALDFYDFKPAPNVPIRDGANLYIDFDNGIFQTDDGQVGDLVRMLSLLQRKDEI